MILKALPLLIASLLLASSPVPAAPARCTTPLPKKTAAAELSKHAKLDQAQAEKLALATLPPGTEATVDEAELEVEKRCLVWSFDLSVKGESFVREVQIDAGDGKVLGTERERRSKEAAEKKEESHG